MIQPKRQPRKLRTVFAIKKDFSDTDSRSFGSTLPVARRAVQSQLSYNDVDLMKSKFRVPKSLNKRQNITPEQLYEYNRKRTRYSYEDYFRTLDSDIVFPDLGIEELEGFGKIQVNCKSINLNGNLIRIGDLLNFRCKKLDTSGNHIDNDQILELLARLIAYCQQLIPPDFNEIRQTRSTIGTVAGSEGYDSSKEASLSKYGSKIFSQLQNDSNQLGKAQAQSEDEKPDSAIFINIQTREQLEELQLKEKINKAEKELENLQDKSSLEKDYNLRQSLTLQESQQQTTSFNGILMYGDGQNESMDEISGHKDEQEQLNTVFQLTQPTNDNNSQSILLSPQKTLRASGSNIHNQIKITVAVDSQNNENNIYNLKLSDEVCTLDYIKENLDKHLKTIQTNFPLFTSVQELDLSENDFDDLVILSWFIKLFGNQLVKLGLQHIQFDSPPDKVRSQANSLNPSTVQNLTFSQKKRLKTNDTDVDHLVNSPVQDLDKYQEEEDYDKPAVDVPPIQSNINIEFKSNQNSKTFSGTSGFIKTDEKLRTIKESTGFDFLMPESARDLNDDIEQIQDLWRDMFITQNSRICQIQLSDSSVGPGLIGGLSLAFPNISIIQLNGVKATPDILPMLCSFKKIRSIDITDSDNIRKVDIITSFLVNNIQRLQSLETIIAIDSNEKDPKVMSKRPDKVYYHIDKTLTIYNNAYTLAKSPIHSEYFNTARIITCELFHRKALPGKKLSALQYSNKLLNNIAVLSNNSLLNKKSGQTQTIRQMTDKEAKQLFTQSSMEVVRQVHSSQNQINIGSSQTYVQPDRMEVSFEQNQSQNVTNQTQNSLGPTATQSQLKKYMDDKNYILKTTKLAVSNNRRTFIMNGVDQYRLFLKQQMQIYSDCEPIHDALSYYFKQTNINNDLMDSAVERNSILFQIKNIADLRSRAREEVANDQFYLTAVNYSENMEENEILPYCKLNYNLENIMDFNDKSIFDQSVLSHLSYQENITGPMSEDELRLFPIDMQGLDKILVDKGASSSKSLYKALQQVLEAPNTYEVDLMDDEILKCLFEK